jgi:ribosomal protein L11
MKVVGGEVTSAAALAPKTGPLGLVSLIGFMIAT